MNERAPNRKAPTLILCIFIAAAALVAFSEVQNHDFVNYDDYRYVVENEHVNAGLTSAGLLWAFTNTEAGFWHPLTWLSHMADCELYGLNPKGHHMSSLVLHIINSIVLFLALNGMTRRTWRSGYVALLFALHPLHVESVAWVSQRKDLLSTFFWVAAMWGYGRYAVRPSLPWYLLCLLLFLLGLMAKPMLVTFPFVLLLLDYWPLRRTPFTTLHPASVPEGVAVPRVSLAWLLREKIPFLILGCAFAALAFWAEKSIGALPSLSAFSLEQRISNAMISYVAYVQKTFWPLHLSVLYPLPQVFPFYRVAACFLLLAVVCGTVVLAARKRPYLFTGWFWYMGTLVPVIGLVQIGSHAMADRYTYVPLIGLFLILAWGVPELVRRLGAERSVLRPVAAAVIVLLGLSTWQQVRHWKDSITLFTSALEATQDNFLAHKNLGFILVLRGRYQEAEHHYREALRIRPNYTEIHYHLANLLDILGRDEEAVHHYDWVIAANPRLERPHFNLGNIFLRQGRIKEAERHYREALKINPALNEAHNNLGLALQKEGQIREAIFHFSEALRIDPHDRKARFNLDLARQQTAQHGERE